MTFDLGEFFKVILMIVVAVPVIAVSILLIRAAITSDLNKK